MKSKVKKGDTVVVLGGKDAGKSGKVLRVMRKKGKILVEGVNMFKKHVKKQNEQQPGGVVDVEKPLDISKVKRKEVVTKKSSKEKKK